MGGPWCALLVALALGALQKGTRDVSLRLQRVQTIEPEFELAGHELFDLAGDGQSALLVVARDGRVRTFAMAERRAAGDGAAREGPPALLGSALGALTLAEPTHSLLGLARLVPGERSAQLLVASPSGVSAYPAGPDGAIATESWALAPRARMRLRLGQPTFAPFVRDVNADERPDLVLPGAEECELWLNEGLPAEAEGGERRLPRFRRTAEIASRITRWGSHDAQQLSNVLESSFAIPNLATRDVNGDSRPDLFVVEEASRSFHLQREDGSFPRVADVRVDLSIFKDTTEAATIQPGQTLAIEDGATFDTRDLDGDGIPDYVIAHRRKVWVFHASRAGPQFKEPTTILKTADDVTALAVVALDDDRFPDLLLVKVQVPTIATILRGLVGEWDVHVGAAGYRNSGGRSFETAPAWKSDLVVRLPSILSVLKDPGRFLERFEELEQRFRPAAFGDLDGDGAQDVLLVSEDAAKLELWLGSREAHGVGRAGGMDRSDAERLLRELLFEDPERVWDLDRILMALGGLAERRVALHTGGRASDAALELRPQGELSLASLETADLDGDARAEVVLGYASGPGRSRAAFDVVQLR